MNRKYVPGKTGVFTNPRPPTNPPLPKEKK